MRLLIGLCCGSMLLGQLRTDVREVQVQVVVKDSKGQPVAGLTKDDFSLTDNGKPQAIRVLSVQDQKAVAKPALAANLFSNTTQAGAGPAVTVVLLDMLNTTFQDMGYARGRIAKAFERLAKGQRFAIYVLGSELRIVRDFTKDSSDIAAALSPQQVDKWVAESMLSVPTVEMTVRGPKTLQGLEAIAQHLAGVKARKNLIWVTSGLPYTFRLPSLRGPTQMVDKLMIARTGRVLADANLVVYPVNAGGQEVDPFVTSERNFYVPRSRMAKVMEPMQAAVDSMDQVAEATGGQSYRSLNDLETVVDLAMKDSSLTYLLSYAPDHGEWKGSWRTLKVAVNRQGLTVRNRPGYFALDQSFKRNEVREVVRDTLQSPLEATGLALLAQRQVSANGKWSLVVKVLPDSLSFAEKDGNSVAKLEFAMHAVNAKGKILSGPAEELSMNLDAALLQQVKQKGILIKREFAVPAEARQVRVVVVDSNSMEAGSLILPIE